MPRRPVNAAAPLAAFAAVLMAAAPAAARDAAPEAEAGLPPALAALLEAAAARGDAEVFADAARTLALTQEAERVIAAAAALGPDYAAQARAALQAGPVAAPAADAETAVALAEADAAPKAGPEADASTDAAEEGEPAPDPKTGVRPAEGFRGALARAGRLIAGGSSELWEGRARLGLRFDSGNADRQDYAAGLELERRLAGWGFKGVIDYAYSEVDDAVGRDEFSASARGERELGERWTVFADAEYERDQLSGFEYTAFLGGGAGYRVFDREGLSWVLRAAPGARFNTPETGEMTTEPAANFTSDFESRLTKAMTLELDTVVLVTEQSRAEQVARVSTALGELWSLEVKYRYRYEFEPEPGFDEHDTRADIAIVREF